MVRFDGTRRKLLKAYMNDRALHELLCMQLRLREGVEPLRVARCRIERLPDKVTPHLQGPTRSRLQHPKETRF